MTEGTAHTTDRYVAFSGGGFNSHSFLAGIIAAGMDGLEASGKGADIDNLLGNVKGVSSSSGGSWFSKHLGFSDKFRAQFESKLGRDAYTKTGYNGQLRQIFESLVFNPDGSLKLPAGKNAASKELRSLAKGINFLRKAAAATGLTSAKNLLDMLQFLPAKVANVASKSGLNWRGFVDEFVNKPAVIGDSLKSIDLSGPRNRWADDVDIVIGAVLQTTPITLGRYGRFNTLAKVKSVPVNQLIPSQRHFTPVSLISMAARAQGKSPSAKAVFTAGDLRRTYFGEILGLRGKKQFNSIIPSTLANKLSLVEAASISSAAIGMLAGAESLLDGPKNAFKLATTKAERLLRKSIYTASLTGANLLSNVFRDFAPAVAIKDGVLGPVPVIGNRTRSTTLASDLGAMRMADSGYIDNSSVNFLLNHIQSTEGTGKPFNITLLMNSNQAPDPITGLLTRIRTGPDATNLSSYGLPSEVTMLFGQSKGDGSMDGITVSNPISPPSHPISAPSPYALDPAAWYGKTTPDWSYSDGKVNLSYFNLNVTTVDNPSFAIKGGQSGKLHVFTAVNSESFASPLSLPMFDQYDINYNSTRIAMGSHGGFTHLSAALLG